MKLVFKIFAFQFERALYSGRVTKYTEKPNPTPATMLGFYLQKTLQNIKIGLHEIPFNYTPTAYAVIELDLPIGRRRNGRRVQPITGNSRWKLL
jgi:hypothetical protein